jgi:hypothetical protein
MDTSTTFILGFHGSPIQVLISIADCWDPELSSELWKHKATLLSQPDSHIVSHRQDAKLKYAEISPIITVLRTIVTPYHKGNLILFRVSLGRVR